jgi:D-serine deaminase-like pyridoxal phosphate-dependent protein
VDAGRKAMNAEYVLPEVRGLQGAKAANFSAEHTVFTLDDPTTPCCVGEKVNLIVGYEDLTVFLHDQLYGIRKGKVEVVWDILGRGKLT